ncbi:hypothetical protein BCR43DRAFT_507304 [Syncephalastrum racemosum]|uniref:Uncharacterized protein n=1 Tax=Syncephalastrum racemosum TaxID=13706 RepID=A0A1X2H6H5_SYNRA|nr:hypothetical protein BCR43DRAFT_507304 [Syncephalastrum racemosum]
MKTFDCIWCGLPFYRKEIKEHEVFECSKSPYRDDYLPEAQYAGAKRRRTEVSDIPTTSAAVATLAVSVAAPVDSPVPSESMAVDFDMPLDDLYDAGTPVSEPAAASDHDSVVSGLLQQLALDASDNLHDSSDAEYDNAGAGADTDIDTDSDSPDETRSDL